MKHLAVCLALLIAPVASAQEAPADIAREASDFLNQAALALSEAEGSRNRIAALTATVQAYERGLTTMREGLRRAALEERAIRSDLKTRDAELMQLLAALQSIERSGGAAQVLHPDGPLPAIRTGMLASELVPALNARAQVVARDLTGVQDIIALQTAGQKQLEEGLAGIRTARLALSQAISNRTDLPAPAATDQATMEALINSSETLTAFADNFATDPTGTVLDDSSWPMPVTGRILRDFNEADAVGVRRPGWIVAADEGAILTTPTPATVRFAGDLPEFGTVVILEPQPGELLILAGAGEVFVNRGQILSKDEPIGFMSGDFAQAQENLIETEQGSGQLGRETLYIELRQGREAVDPGSRFNGQTD
ncbi:MAG: peptidase M23 [Boseongicola sp.]|nr:peptidase M23 [Boseongicola sp.]